MLWLRIDQMTESVRDDLSLFIWSELWINFCGIFLNPNRQPLGVEKDPQKIDPSFALDFSLPSRNR
jgi:hypothetical protein